MIAKVWLKLGLWQASGDTSLPGAVAAALKIQPQEAEALLGKMLEEGK